MQSHSDLVQILADMRDGDALIDMNDKLNEMVHGVLETGKAGEFTLKLKVSPAKHSMTEGVLEVAVAYAVTTKVPELSIPEALFFVTKDQTLTRTNPKQAALFAQVQEDIRANG